MATSLASTTDTFLDLAPGRPVVRLFWHHFGMIDVWYDVATCFGKSRRFGTGLVWLAPVFLMILAFGSAEYRGPVTDREDAEISVSNEEALTER